MGRLDIRAGQAQQGAPESHEVSSDTQEDQDFQETRPVHASGSAFRCSSQSAGNLRYYIQMHGHE